MTYLKIRRKEDVFLSDTQYNVCIVISYRLRGEQTEMDHLTNLYGNDKTIVLIAEPPGPCRWALHHLLEESAIVTDVVDTGLEAILYARQHQPDVVVLSQKLTDISLKQVTEYVLRVSPSSKIFLLSDNPDSADVTSALEHARRLVTEETLREV
jgi:CheY-like chemotaxis protein